MKNYHVEFSIEVDAETSIEACKRAWELLSGPDALLPVGRVIPFDGNGESATVDLQELENEKQPN